MTSSEPLQLAIFPRCALDITSYKQIQDTPTRCTHTRLIFCIMCIYFWTLCIRLHKSNLYQNIFHYFFSVTVTLNKPRFFKQGMQGCRKELHIWHCFFISVRNNAKSHVLLSLGEWNTDFHLQHREGGKWS